MIRSDSKESIGDKPREVSQIDLTEILKRKIKD
jgi:hypothetical protein